MITRLNIRRRRTLMITSEKGRLREEFVKAAMHGFISAGGNGMPNKECVAKLANDYAEATLATLEKRVRENK